VENPEATVLHEVVRENLATFFLEYAQEGGLPRFVEKDFTGYLECGVLAHGFSRVVCSDCKDEFVVGYSRVFCSPVRTSTAFTVARPASSPTL
jgi:hypothetical protein